MSVRAAEIAGGGFAGLAAAVALAQRGWRVRVHERGTTLRTTGAGIYIYENGLRVLEAFGAYDDAVATAPLATTREVRDEANQVVSVHNWGTSARVYSIVRQRVIDALAAAARRAGAEIVTDSEIVRASTTGEVTFADGSTASADLVVAADGIGSRLRDRLGLVRRRRSMADGAIRALLPYEAGERETVDVNRTIEYWSGKRRVLYTPCSDGQLYLALTMLDSDRVGRAVPIDVAAWSGAFPYLAPLFPRLGPEARYDRFGYVSLKRWSAGRVAVIGDAAHALPPNIGQGAGCSMMNALSLAEHLDRLPNMPAALAAWERTERPLTAHTQRVSVFLGLPTTWPAPLRRLFFRTAGRSTRMTEMRTRTARHIPTGTQTT
jgi:2-polyprenyl-6-methoxyphenol hydroxylase-like FAD-dependent oxidoreductase